MGLDVPEEHFYTSALATAAFLKEQAPGCSVFAIGEAGLLNALYDAGITMNDVNPDYVVVGEGRSYSLDTLTKATNLVMAGAKLIGANSDVSGPIENGIAPACRALISPIEMATGKQAYFCGKPNPLDDAHRIADAALPLRRGGDGGRPHGHRCDLRHGERHVHGAGALRCVHPRNAEDLCLPPQHRAERRGRHPRSGAGALTVRPLKARVKNRKNGDAERLRFSHRAFCRRVQVRGIILSPSRAAPCGWPPPCGSGRSR